MHMWTLKNQHINELTKTNEQRKRRIYARVLSSLLKQFPVKGEDHQERRCTSLGYPLRTSAAETFN